MSEKQLSGLLVLLIPMLIKEIVNNENMTEEEATQSLYESELYAGLETEKTKLWHLSAKALYELYKQEKTTGKINYPEEA